jgi:hypothetical protein
MRSAVLSCLVASWLTAFACFTAGPEVPDGGGEASADASCGAFGCDVAPSIDPFGDAALPLRIRSLFQGTTCAGAPENQCHAGATGNTTLDLDMDAANYSIFGLVNVASSELPDVLRVEPFHPESSYLYWKVTGDPRILDGSLTMPASTDTVDPRIVAMVGPWIEAGAP